MTDLSKPANQLYWLSRRAAYHKSRDSVTIIIDGKQQRLEARR